MEKKVGKHVRQGDVLIIKVDSLPKNATVNKNKVVAEGEGHHEHVICDGEVCVTPEGVLYADIKEDTVLRHLITNTTKSGDHLPIDIAETLGEGPTEVRHQREYDPYEQAIRRLAD